MRKSIAIIGEGETEWFYFDSLRVACRYPFKLSPGFPQHADIGHILKMAKAKISEGYDYVVCLIDMDRLHEKPAEMNYFKRTKLYEYLRYNGDIERAKANADKLSQMSKASPKDKIAYSAIHKVINLLDELNY